MASPLEQFAIQNVTAPLFSIGGHPIAVTNSAVFMMASVVVSAGLLYAGATKGAMVPGRIQAMSELFYDFIANMIRDNVGKGGDDTLFALADGKVKFGSRRNRKIVNVVPVEA